MLFGIDWFLDSHIYFYLKEEQYVGLLLYVGSYNFLIYIAKYIWKTHADAVQKPSL